jgi:hypothetical protein
VKAPRAVCKGLKILQNTKGESYEKEYFEVNAVDGSYKCDASFL